MNYAKALRLLRAILNYDQGDTSAKAGLNRGYLSLLENGRREPRLTTVYAIARAAGVTPELLDVLAWEEADRDSATEPERHRAGAKLLALTCGRPNRADHVVHLPNGREVSDEVRDLAARAAFEAEQVAGLAFTPEGETPERQDHHVWGTAPASDRKEAEQVAWDVLVDRKSNEESFQRWMSARSVGPADPLDAVPNATERYRTSHYLACDAARDVGETMLRLSDRAVIETRERVATPAPDA